MLVFSFLRLFKCPPNYPPNYPLPIHYLSTYTLFEERWVIMSCASGSRMMLAGLTIHMFQACMATLVWSAF